MKFRAKIADAACLNHFTRERGRGRRGRGGGDGGEHGGRKGPDRAERGAAARVCGRRALTSAGCPGPVPSSRLLRAGLLGGWGDIGAAKELPGGRGALLAGS